MIRHDVIALSSPPGTGTCPLDDLLVRLEATGRSGRHVLALTAFVDAPDTATYAARRAEIEDRLADAFGGVPPPASLVAQAPEGDLAIEAAVLADPALEATRRTYDGVRYSVVRRGDERRVFGAGIASAADRADTAAQADETFSRMEALLRREGLDFGHVVRQWNYIEAMLEVRRQGRDQTQGYQALNDVRTCAYGRSVFPAGYPAATGIGQTAGGVVLEFVAIDGPADLRIAPVSNPNQIDAHRYSEGVLVGDASADLAAKSPPKFERAKRLVRGGDETVFVSGTASIIGEESVGIGDVVAQTHTTLDNIAALLDGRPLTQIRAYVKRSVDVPLVRDVCEARCGSIPALYVRADVCRPELLVEIEGSLVAAASEESR